MRRILVILLLFISLASAPHIRKEVPFPRTSLVVKMTPFAVSPQIQKDYGPLRLTGLWVLTGSHRVFGGISSLLEQNGQFTALSDKGEWFRFGLGSSVGFGEALPRFRAEREIPRYRWDSESMTRDPVSGKLWVGFESLQRICRYAPDFARIERCVTPPEVEAWPITGSIESLVRFGDGRFLAISEMGRRSTGLHDVLLWASDPTEPGAPKPVHLSYKPPTGFRPTDALWLGGDRLLVLNRRLTVADLFTARLALVRLPKLTENAVLKAEPIADFHRPGPTDNMEALALGRDERGGPILWVASDDNHAFFEETLLFRFALPKEWVNAEPAP